MQSVSSGFTTTVDMDFNSSSKAQAKRDAVVDNRIDQTCCNTLMFLLDGVAQNDGCSWEAHIHSPWDQNRTYKGLRPVCLVDWRGTDKDITEEEHHEADGHDPCWTNSRQEKPCSDCSYRTGDGQR